MSLQAFAHAASPNAPSSGTMLETMRRENEDLRNRLVDTERNYIRIMRLNDIYREELIDHRRRVSSVSFVKQSNYVDMRIG